MKKIFSERVVLAASLWLGLSIGSWAQSAYEKLTIVDNVCQIATAEDLGNFAQAVNDDSNTLDAVLTADIDYPNGMMIGTDVLYYAGTFDGQQHKITYDITATAKGAGLFRSLSGTVKNLNVDGTLHISSNLAGTIAGWIYGGTVQNCVSTVTIDGTLSGDAAYAGIASRASSGTSVIDHCIYAGKIEAPMANNCAGILGWLGDNCYATISNCIYSGEINHAGSSGENISYTISRRPSQATITNVYYINENITANEGAVQVTTDDVTSGALCYLINGKKPGTDWTQTLGEDLFPIPFDNHGVVSAQGNLLCTGLPAEGEVVTYTNGEGSPIPDHTYVDGVCTVCGKTDPGMSELIDGYYQLGTPEQFAWFAKKVNQGDLNINAKLIDDIDLSNATFDVVGSSSGRYKGIFDGQYHTITINMTAPASSYGLFRYLEGTVKNLHIDGFLDAAFNKVGPLAGEIFGATIENVWSSVEVAATYYGDAAISGLVGRGSGANSTLRNCLFTGNITGENCYNCAGFVGWVGDNNTTNIENCVIIGTIKVDESQGNAHIISRNPTYSICTNCYYVNPYGSINAGATQISEQELSDGSLCYNLNGDQSNVVWTQNVDFEEYPIPVLREEYKVYGVAGVCGNAGDADTFADYKKKIIDNQQQYCNDVCAQKTVIAEYEQALSQIAACTTLDELLTTWNGLKPLYESLKESEAAYTAYKAKVDEVSKYLEEHTDFSNEKRDELESYLKDEEDPGELFANGSASYILENGLLSVEEIQAEAKKVDKMLEIAITFSPASGTNVTKLLTNPDFSDGFNGWQGTVGDATGKSTTSPYYGAQCLNATCDLYQTLSGLQNGIYELQVNGAFDPYPRENRYGMNYAAMLYANDVCNYFQTNIEDMIGVADAADGFNCNITGNGADFEVQDIEGTVVGYTMNGVISVSNAIQGERYKNSVLCEVTDGVLTIGIKQPGTGNQPEWLGFGNVQLIYHGTVEEATDGLDNVLASMTARANTLVNEYVPSIGDDYASSPNFSQELKDALSTTMEDVKATTDNASKWQLVQKYSYLFQQVYECKKAYVNMMAQFVRLQDVATQLAASLTDEQLAELNNAMEFTMNGYVDGSASAEEAGLDRIKSLSFYPTQTADGTYHLTSAASYMLFRDAMMSGETAANAVLEADIDLTALEDPSFSYPDLHYAGTFDGQGHTITVNMTATAANYGFIRSLDGTVKNLHLAGNLATAYNRVGAVAGESFGGKIQNVWSSVDVVSTQGGDGAISGILGRSSSDGTLIENCIYSGRITGDSYNSASMIGYSPSTSTISNCIFCGLIELAVAGNEYTFARNSTRVTYGTNYYVNAYGSVDPGSVQVTMEQLASGEICYQLNGDQKTINWYQTLGESAFPVPLPIQETVYIQGGVKCDGYTPKDLSAVTWGNTPGAVVDEHNFQNGVCIECGAANPDMAELKDGYYQIGTVDQFVWFAAKVNGGDNSINAQLTADIDMTGYENKTVMVGNVDHYFAGEFDGQGHTLTVDLVAAANNCAPFQYSSGTIRRLHVAGNISSSYKFNAGVCAQQFGGVIEKCWSSVAINLLISGDSGTGGIVARTSADGSLISDCLFDGSFTGATADNCGGIVGWSANLGTIRNCLQIGDIQMLETNSYTIARNPSKVTGINNYYKTPFGGINEGATQITEEQLANGEVLALLNAGSEVPAWIQDGTAYPIPFAEDAPAATGFQYYMLAIESLQNANNCIQLSEFDLLIGGEELASLAYYGSQNANTNTNEGLENLCDNTTSTKWCGSFSAPAYIFFDAGQVVTPEAYRMYTANDNATSVNRSPATWKLYGSNTRAESAEDAQWVLIDARSNDFTMQNVNFTPFDFQISYKWGTGIQSVNEGITKSARGIYNMMGQKVQKAQHGVFIIDGRKVFVK